MSDIKARYVGDNPEGVTLGVILEDGDLYPYAVPHGGELPQEIDGRKVSTEYRNGLLAQEGVWTTVRRDTKPTAKADEEAK
jgi:hypothetical protein